MTELIKNQRAYVKGRITYYWNAINDEKNTFTYYQLVTIDKHLAKLYQKFDGLQEKLEELDSNESKSDERNNFETSYCNLEARLLEKMSEVEPCDNKQKLNNRPIDYTPKCRLPELELPKFDGKYSSWLTFKDEYENLIHKSEEIEDIDKFRYLISCVRDGEAYSIIEFLPRTTVNYSVAWNRLMDSYDNEAVILKNYMRDIYNLTNVRENSISSLQTFVDNFLKYFNALKALKIDVSSWDLFIVHHLSQKLDHKTRSEVEIKSPVNTLLTIDGFIKILTDRIRFMSAMNQTSTSQFKIMNRQNHKNPRTMVSTSQKCSMCSAGDHTIYKCENFHKLTPVERYDIVKKQKLCINCLGNDHIWQKCNNKFSCRICGKRHHSLLHRTNTHPNSNTNAVSHRNVISTPVNATAGSNGQHSSNQDCLEISNAATSLASTHNNKPTKSCIVSKQILIATAIVWVTDDAGFRIPCRVILDSASHAHFVTESFCKKLNVKRKSCSSSIAGVGESNLKVNHMVSILVSSMFSHYSATLDCLVLPKVTNELPLYSFDYDQSQLPPNFELADPYFNVADKVDMLIGTELYHEIVSGERMRIVDGFPPFIKTEFGYVISGKVEFANQSKNVCSFITTLDEINSNIQRFWTIESIQVPTTLSIEDKECERHYSENVYRKPDGRYSVALPTKINLNKLETSKIHAHRQFLRLERQLINNKDLYDQYKNFMTEYIDLNHMELALPGNSQSVEHEYYLPHHCVHKLTSESTKFRVVFNGSFKTLSKLSLNDVLKIGPTIQQDLFTILARFRKHPYVFTADIIKMYRQIEVCDKDRNLQKIWWRSSPSLPLQTFRLKTVTYGTACAPFLAIRTLKQLSMDEKINFPKAAKILLSDFYVDDVLSGSTSIAEVDRLHTELSELLKTGGFELSKFASNYSDIASVSSSNSSSRNSDIVSERNLLQSNVFKLPSKQQMINMIDSSSHHHVKRVLGIIWDTTRDSFLISFGKLQDKSIFTKRTVLSEITQIFDPLGLCAPIVFSAKYFMQRIWSNPQLSWDDPLTPQLLEDWKEFRTQLLQFNTISVPRCIVPISGPVQHILHGFGDASEKGYGCCIYISSYSTDNCITRLICSKSRIAPLRKQTIPRLELCASVLLTELMDKVQKGLDINFQSSFFWTDSLITLYRIKSHPSKYSTFVANRVSQIQESSHPNHWFYVPTQENPADFVSRGLLPSEIQRCSLWWCGPDFLNKSKIEWPTQPNKNPDSEDDEFRKSEVTLLQCSKRADKWKDHDELNIFSRFSSYIKLLRVVALCLRFLSNCHHKKNGNNLNVSSLTPKEIENSLFRLVKLLQRHAYKNDIQQLVKHEKLSKLSKLLQLAPFLDDNGIVRVGGRLSQSDLSYEQKHPILLPDHIFSELLVRHKHNDNLHAGPQYLLNNVRQQFWIINGRNICRRVVHSCIRCFKLRPITHQQVMGQLPLERITPNRPFLNVGIDFCGPFHACSRIRSKIKIKVYISVFVCFCSKAVHMELVQDLTTGAFLAAFRRFVARRGIPVQVFSDNATNFVGAQNELKDLLKIFNSENQNNEILRFCTDKGVSWKTIPPRSPHFGGLWEAAIKSAKFHIKRTLCTESFTVEELETVVAEAEAVLNSRPLTPMSTDPNDLTVLTPGHLLIGDHLTTPPDPNVLHLKFNCLTRWQRIQYVIQLFWRRWSREYLSELQCRKKWHNDTEIKIGTMVILKDDNLPTLKWILGRITKVYSGPDNKIRVVDVKTTNGIFKRSVNKICILPFEGNSPT